MGTLTIIGTPIGNLEDVSFRALQALREVELLICEDTRVTRKIYSRYQIPFPSKVVACFEAREESLVSYVLKELDAGVRIGLCTDSGMPTISDPGYKLIRAVIEKGHEVDVIPGPTAGIVSLILSGLPTSSFTFKGFPPKKEGALTKFLEMEKDSPHTLVFYESPYRVMKFLKMAYQVYGDRACAVCFELTKKFERVYRGYLNDMPSQLEKDTLKGEVTIVIAGNHPKFVKEVG